MTMVKIWLIYIYIYGNPPKSSGFPYTKWMVYMGTSSNIWFIMVNMVNTWLMMVNICLVNVNDG